MLLMIVLGFSVLTPAFPQTPQDEVTDEEYAVYSALLAQNTKLVIIQNSESKDIQDENYNDFIKESLAKIKFSNSLPVRVVDDYASRKPPHSSSEESFQYQGSVFEHKRSRDR